jgi:hypothetical protein
VTSAEVEALIRDGAVVKCTALNGEFGIEAFRKLYGESALILFRINASGELSVAGPESGSYASGEQLIALVREPEMSGKS